MMLTRIRSGQEGLTSVFLLSLILIALILKLFNVFNAPTHWDTGLYLNITVGYFERGILTPLMWRFNPEWNIITGSGSGYGIFIMIAWLRLFGVTVVSGHLLMYLVGLLNLPIVYVLVKRFYGSAQGALWAVGFFALTYSFADHFYLRMDALNVLTCSLILVLHLEAVRRGKWWLHMATGAALVAALEVHVLAAYYAGAIGAYHAIQHLRLMWQERSIVLWSPATAWGIGLAGAAAIYFWHHVAPNPDLYLLIPRSCNICSERGLLTELSRWWRFFSQQAIFLVGLSVLVLSSALVRRTAADQHLLSLLGGAHLALVVLNPPITQEYTGHLMPLYALGVGGLFAHGLSRASPLLSAVRIGGYCLYVAGLIALPPRTHFTPSRSVVTNTYQISPSEYAAAIHYIRTKLPPTVVIVGRENYYVDLVESGFNGYLSHRGHELLGIRYRNEAYHDLWQRENVQAFIWEANADPDIQRYITAHGGFVEVLPKLWVDKALLEVVASGSNPRR
jgi:hypothetical protein